MSIPKICPLIAANSPVHMAKCREDGCAWWDGPMGFCSVFAATERIRGIEQQLNVLNIILEENEPPRSGVTERLEGGTELIAASTSNDTKNEEEKQA